MIPMKVSESIEAHLCSAVAAIAQRNQATLSGKVSGHPIFLISVFNRLYRLAKAFGFCLYFYPLYRRARSFKALRLLRTVSQRSLNCVILSGVQSTKSKNLYKEFYLTASNI